MKKQVALITGCSSGIGKNLCAELMKKGYIVVATARNTKKLEELQADMKVKLDVTDEKSVTDAVRYVLARFGRIDVLINNAGYSFRSAVEEIHLSELKKMYEVNVYGIIRMMQAVLPYMREQHTGKIMNIGSISGKLTGSINGAYCASKHAVEAITEAARYELMNFGIQVTVIEPGAMDTDFFQKLAVNSEEQMKNPDSPYAACYQKDMEYRKKQKRASVQKSAERIADIVIKEKWKTRYTVSLPIIYKILIRLPDALKESLLTIFNSYKKSDNIMNK